jgi:hypothetical protein
MIWLIRYLKNWLTIFRNERQFSYMKPNSSHILVCHCFLHLALQAQ